MVVCKCRKATKLCCFVHKIPVCSECICFPDHQQCVVRTYSEWVIDGDYDWPPKCSLCQQAFLDTDATTRLGCLHVLHTACLEAHLKGFPVHTAPAGYICPACSSPIWPPKNSRDLNTLLASKLKEAIQQAGIAGTLIGADSVLEKSSPAPSAFSSPPLFSPPDNGNVVAASKSSENSQREFSTATDVKVGGINVVEGVVDLRGVETVNSGAYQESEISADVPSHSTSTSPSVNPQLPKNVQGTAGATTTRKGSYRGDRAAASIFINDDDDAISKKYSRRGPFYRQVLRYVLPFWSPTMPTLPVTAPKREDRFSEEQVDTPPRRRHHRSTIDPRKILLFLAMLSCLATILLLYYRLLQTSDSSSAE